MISKSVFIFSLEGEKSNTEINFYNGLSHYVCDKMSMHIFAIGQQADKDKSKQRVEQSLRIAIQKSKIFDSESIKQVFVFFIGDGDVRDQIPPMQRAMETCIKQLEEKYKPLLIDKEFSINNTLIYDPDLGFENAFIRIKNSKFTSPKIEGNKKLFNDFAESAIWLNDDQTLNVKKILSDLREINSAHLTIFEHILKGI